MTHRILYVSFALMLVASLAAQTSEAAKKQAGSWFNDRGSSYEIFSARLQRVGKADIDVWEAAANKAALGFTKGGGLLFSLTDFQLLWSSDNKPVPGAIAKYAKRLEQLSGKVVEEWRILADADIYRAAASLIAENELFPQEAFSDKAFQTFKAKFK